MAELLPATSESNDTFVKMTLSPRISLIPRSVIDPWPCASAQNPGRMWAGKLGGFCQPLTKTFQCCFTQKVSHHLTLTQDAGGSKTHHDVNHVALRT